jgi:outer membrane protein OmpA-like peptidoglycan-associated protein
MNVMKPCLAVSIAIVALAGCTKAPFATPVSGLAPLGRAAAPTEPRPVTPTPRAAAARGAAALHPSQFKPAEALKDIHFDFDRYDLLADSRIDLISDGEDRPLCTERAEACWARNRRAHFITKPE